ncbi:hypothetical protein C7S18_14275 [Ahniella affigens]|uniref:Uncharacterized protein n=1 Tax=Ahniella affigens TaxID=2021234 RepID=A0A2P1PTX2_9GAMM|nr:hypothetical protein C7S18_14275 [Ahniella affigens]
MAQQSAGSTGSDEPVRRTQDDSKRQRIGQGDEADLAERRLRGRPGQGSQTLLARVKPPTSS